MVRIQSPQQSQLETLRFLPRAERCMAVQRVPIGHWISKASIPAKQCIIRSKKQKWEIQVIYIDGRLDRERNISHGAFMSED